LFTFRRSPMKITYKKTGQQIRFRGVEDSKRIRSQKFRHGYCAILWIEETAEFDSMEEINDLVATFCRGGSLFWVLCSYNPPRSARNWVNKEAKIITSEGGKTDRFICHTTYLDIVGEHPEWISEQAVIEAERLKKHNPDAHRHMWLGDVIGTGAEVFPDELLDIREVTPEELEGLDTFSFGVDAGSAHPWVMEHMAFDVDERILYILEEESRKGSAAHDTKTVQILIDHLDEFGDPDAEVWCDSAARGMILYYQDQGVNAMKAYKQGLNSPKDRIRWFCNLHRIVIDPAGAPMAAKQFPDYEYKPNAQGDTTEILPKVDDDAIDAVGYGASEWIRSNL
ncbi:PBSX family phage terminase large subunit, partial [Gordonibacter sp.]|uniref:PBSX family phage terminase large subunit n=1 Tax=Gordonibacter sp. TaxID=1968902 RepID=UPI002FC81564